MDRFAEIGRRSRAAVVDQFNRTDAASREVRDPLVAATVDGIHRSLAWGLGLVDRSPHLDLCGPVTVMSLEREHMAVARFVFAGVGPLEPRRFALGVRLAVAWLLGTERDAALEPI